MQQNQKKSEATSKKTSGFGKMMLQRDKDRLKSVQKHAYIELLKAPRGKEYLRLLAETGRLSEQLKELDDEIACIEAELEQEAVTLPTSDVLDGITNEPVQEEPEIQTEIEQPREQVNWKSARVDTGASVRRFKEKQKRLEEKRRQHAALEEELRVATEKFIAQLPAPEVRIGAVWPDCNTYALLKYGIIGCPGSAYHSPEELIRHVQPRSEQEERQWLRGDGAFQVRMEYEAQCERRGKPLPENEKLFIVEIYMDAICVVYKDGSTNVME